MGKKGNGGNKKLNILIRAELNKNQFKEELDSQLLGLQKVLDGKGLKIDVNLDSVNKVKNVTDDIGKNLQNGLKASKSELDKMAKTMEKLNKEMDEINKNRADSIKRARNDWDAMQKETVWGKMKEYGVRRPMKGEQYYEDFRQLPESIRKNPNYFKPGSQKKYNTIDTFLQEAGLDKSMNPSQMFQVLNKGLPKFDAQTALDPDTLKGIELGEKRIKEITSELAKLNKDFKEMGQIIEKQTDQIESQTRKVKEQEKAVEKVASAWKKVSVATTSVGEGEDKTPTSRVTNLKDQNGNRKVQRETFDAESREWVHDSETYISALKEIEEAKQKFGLKHGKWADRIAEVNTKAFKMNGHGLEDIKKLTDQLEKMDATSDKIEFDKFDNELKKLEKSMKDNLKAFQEFEKRKNALSERGAKMSQDGMITEKQLDQINKHLGVAKFDKSDGEARLKQIEEEMTKKEQMVKAEREDAEIRKKLNAIEQNRLAELEKQRAIEETKEKARQDRFAKLRKDALDREIKGLNDLARKRDAYYKKIGELQSQGMGQSSANRMKGMVANNDFAGMERSLKIVDEYKRKQKQIADDRDKEFELNASRLKKEKQLREQQQKDTLRLQEKERKQTEGIKAVREQALQRQIKQEKAIRKEREDYYKLINKYKDLGLGQASVNRLKGMAQNNDFDRLDKSIQSIDSYMRKQKQLSDDQDKAYKLNNANLKAEAQEKERQAKEQEAQRKKQEKDREDQIKKQKQLDNLKDASHKRQIKNEEDLRKKRNKYYETIKKYEKLGLGQASSGRLNSMANNNEFDRLEKALDAIDKYMQKEKTLSDVKDKEFAREIARQRKAEKDNQSIVEGKEKLRKKLVQLAQQGKATNQDLNQMARMVNTSQSIGDIDKAQRAIERLATSHRVLQQQEQQRERQARQQSAVDLGTIRNFTRLNDISDAHIRDVLKTNDAYKNRRVIATSVNRVTGEWTATIRENGRQERIIRGEIDRTTGAIRQQGDVIRDTSSRNLGFLEQFRIALTRVPVWAGAMTLIYGTQHALQAMVETIMEVDTQMTELKRVMDEDTNFNQMLEESITMSKELGNNLQDVNKAIIGFARQGFDAQESLEMANTAIIASNVSELTADEAMEDLTAIMVQFNKTAKESIQIVDALNEVDNNFAITTKNLADATAKAGATAQTFGVSFEEMLGHVTAIGVATRESGSVVGNSLKTIYSRLTTMPEAVDALSAVGVSVTDLEGNMRDVTDILSDLNLVWGDLSKAQKQNMAVTLAGRYQLSRFLALMNNFEMGAKATKTALNSQGSAMRENEKYLESMQAQVNRLKVAWNEMSLAWGNEFLGAVFIGIVKGLTGMANAMTAVSKSGFTLPVIFGLIASILLILSPRIRNFILALSETQYRSTALGVSLLRLQSVMTSLATTARASGAMIIGSLAFMGVFMAVGWGITKLIDIYKKKREEEKALEEQQHKIADSYTNHKDRIQELVAEYEKLNAIGLKTAEQDAKYKEVTNELAELLPNVVKKIDEKGNAHLKNADAIKEELKYAEQLAKNSLGKKVENADKTFKDKIEERKKAQKEIAKIEKEIAELENGTARMRKQLQTGGVEAGYDPLEGFDESEEINKLELKLLGLNATVNRTSHDIKDDFKEITKAVMNLDGVNTDKIEKRFEKLMDSVKGEDLAELGSDRVTAMANQFAKAVTAMENIDKASMGAIANAEKNLRSILEEMGLSDRKINVFIDGFLGAKNAVEDFDRGIAEASMNMTDINAKYKESADQVSTYNELLERMAEGKSLTASEAVDLISKEEELAKAITFENGLVKVNIKAVEAMRDAKIQTFRDIIEARKADVQASTEALKVKLQNYGYEVKGLMTVADAQKALADMEKQHDERRKNVRSIAEGTYVDSSYTESVADVNAIKDAYEALEEMAGMTSKGLTEVGTSLEKNDKDTKESTYVTDKYKQALEAINLLLEKQSAIKRKFPQHSKQYRDAIKKEIELLQTKQGLMDAESKSLEKQVSSGNVIAKGKTKTTTSSSGGKYTGGQYGSIISEASSKYGVDANLISAIIKQESGFNANAKSHAGAMGLMQLMPATARGLGVSNAYDPYQNIMGGTKYIADQLKAFGGNIEKALAAYNAGPGNVRKYGGIPPFEETKNYVKNIMANYKGGSGTVAVATGSNADNLENIDKAKSELNQIQGEIVDVNELISQLKVDLINSEVAGYENWFEKYEKNMEASESRLWKYTVTSKEYRKELENQMMLIKNKQIVNNKELAYLQNTLNNANKLGLSAVAVDELQQKLHELRIRNNQLAEAMSNVNKQMEEALWAIVEADIQKVRDAMDDLDHELAMLDGRMGLLNEESVEYIGLLQEQAKLLDEKQKHVEKEIRYVENQLKNEKLSVEQKKELKEVLEELNEELIGYENNLQDVNDKLKETVTSTLDAQKTKHLDAIKEELENITKQREADIKAMEDYYDALITKQQETLKLLEETYEEEDRIKQLRDINDQIDKAKGDKRFSYITAEGKEILTYNKGQVNELEKQRDEMIKQFERDDAKKAIQDEIDRLEQAKETKIAQMEQELEALTASYNARLEQTEQFWDNLITGVQEGTIEYNSLMASWYSTALEELKNFGEDVDKELDKIKKAFASMAEMKDKSTTGATKGTGGSAVKYDPKKDTANSFGGVGWVQMVSPDGKYLSVQKDYIEKFANKGYVIDKYHEGGQVGGKITNRLSDIANKMFNANANEQVIMALKGEIMTPEKNIASKFIPNLRKLMGSVVTGGQTLVTQKHYHFKDMTIKTDNMSKFLESIDFLVKSEGK